MTTVTVSQSDYGYSLAFTVTNADGTAKDLTGYTVSLKVLRGTTSTNLGACAVQSAVGGTCTYTVKSGDFAIDGLYAAELEFTKAGTVESSEPFDLDVRRSW